MASTISEFYRDRSIFITGATGFMGKVLVEKLLRSCPGIRKVYLLMRPKQGQDVRQRLDEMFQVQIFETLKESQPEVINKVIPIKGDVMEPELGISNSDAALLMNEVSVVFHCAATVKFDEALKLAVEMNIAGTRRVVELCRKMTNLASLVHVSTAYCNCDREEITEAVYPLPMKPQQLIDTVEWMDNGLAQKIVPDLVGDRPNTYTFTKAMAEYMLVEECSDMPIAIVRPSIVTAAWKEPIPGWVDNLNGPIGLLIGAGKGLMRSTLCQGTYVADFIPVDIPINLMIAAAWLTATDRFDNLMVYNCTSGDLNPMTWNDMVRYSFPVAVKNPLTGALWYPSTRFPTNRLVHNYHGVFLQYVNAYIIDSAAWLVGKKRRLVNIQEKVCRAQKSLEYFTTHQWRFTNDNIKMIWEKLQPADKELFPFDVTEVVWLPFWQNYWLGGKFFVLRETLETIPTARSHNNRMLIVDHIYQSLKLLILWRVLRANSSIIFGASNWFVKAMSRFSSLLPFQRGT